MIWEKDGRGEVSTGLHRRGKMPSLTGRVSGSCSPRGGPRWQLRDLLTLEPTASSLGSAPQGLPKERKYRARHTNVGTFISKADIRKRE